MVMSFLSRLISLTGRPAVLSRTVRATCARKHA
jgi:hypothetical protein